MVLTLLSNAGVLDAGTLVPLGVVLAVAAVLVPLIIKLVRELARLSQEIAGLRSMLRKSWTIEHHAAWSSELRDKNPDLTLPDVYGIAAKVREINQSDSEAA